MATGTLPHLPSEVLEAIFLHLPIKSLLQARLTCHRYRNIIDDCPALRSRFCLKFPIDITLNRAFQPGSLLPASRVVFDKLVIRNVSEWWPQVGSRITHLTLNSCKFPLGMLRFVPNLKQLELKDVKLVDRNNNKFVLKSLKNLLIYDTQVEILDSLEKVIPKSLVKFTFLSEGYSFNRYNLNLKIVNNVEAQLKIIQFIASKQDFLEEIYIHPVKCVSAQLFQLTQCKLKSFTIERHNFESKEVYERNLLQFVRAQPTLEKLVMNEPISVRVANDINQSLPNLKQLTLHSRYVEGFDTNMFFKTMNNLQILYLSGDTKLNYVSDCNLPKLKEFILSVAKVKGNSLQKFLKHSTTLTDLTLIGCHFENWSDFLSLLVQLNSLKGLMLIFTGEFIANHDRFQAAAASNAKLSIQKLRTMKIMEYGNVTFEEWDALLRMCSQLSYLNLNGIAKAIQTRLVESVCPRLTRLETMYADL